MVSANPGQADPDRAAQAMHAAAELHHAWITGLVLALVNRIGHDAAERFVFHLFRRQHEQRFLPGLAKLGLDKLPHSIACARYHYFSNQLGGVKVEYLEESERKAWVRYPPPRWIWASTAICAVPSNVNRAMLRGWHAHNGVTLGNPRLGFVCTKTTVDGDPGLEGYYFEYDHPLQPSERLRFAPDEACPWIDPATLPLLDARAWPETRKALASRNYATEYIRNALPILIELLGPETARDVGRIAGRQIGMHSADAIEARLGGRTGAAGFLDLLAELLEGAGDRVERQNNSVVRLEWRMIGATTNHPALPDLWRAPYDGLLSVHDRFLRMTIEDDRFTIAPGRG
jgi:hypothetical protein